MPIEIIAHDLVQPIAARPTLRLRLTSQHNQPISGTLRVALSGLAVEAPSQLEFEPREQQWLELPVSGTARPDNTYPLMITFDAGPLGLAAHTEALHVNWISRKTIRVDGQLDDWQGALTIAIALRALGVSALSSTHTHEFLLA